MHPPRKKCPLIVSELYPQRHVAGLVPVINTSSSAGDILGCIVEVDAAPTKGEGVAEPARALLNPSLVCAKNG